MNFLPDPCALPDAQKKRALNEKERLLYAPMSGVGGLVYDKDAVYIDVPASHVKQQQVRLRFAAEKLNLGASVAGFGPIFFFPA